MLITAIETTSMHLVQSNVTSKAHHPPRVFTPHVHRLSYILRVGLARNVRRRMRGVDNVVIVQHKRAAVSLVADLSIAALKHSEATRVAV